MFCTLRKYFLERSVDIILKASIPKLREKLLEALQAVLPIVAIVLVLCFSIAPVSPSILLCFLLGAALSAGVSLSVGLAMVRVLTGISILWFLIPGYAFAIGISFVVPKLYTAIAFDAGGVASGPMTATFLLPLAQGACVAVGGNIVTDAFGVVAMVAMTPLITVQLMGLMAQLKQRRARQAQPVPAAALAFADLPDDAIIEL